MLPQHHISYGAILSWQLPEGVQVRSWASGWPWPCAACCGLLTTALGPASAQCHSHTPRPRCRRGRGCSYPYCPWRKAQLLRNKTLPLHYMAGAGGGAGAILGLPLLPLALLLPVDYVDTVTPLLHIAAAGEQPSCRISLKQRCAVHMAGAGGGAGAIFGLPLALLLPAWASLPLAAQSGLTSWSYLFWDREGTEKCGRCGRCGVEQCQRSNVRGGRGGE